MNDKLGRLEKIDLREVWNGEASDFTPWLAEDENLKLLGDTIGIELELEAQEKDVGPFRADLLCKDTGSDKWVLIENQLEKTDHTHLGQLMTYASGLDTVTIVWIAQRFTDEHRAAMDWLNNITESDFNFFALEVELWKIGDSHIAPKFNIVSKPNDWTKPGGSISKRFSASELSPTKKLQLAFWTALKERLVEKDSFLKPQKPYPQHWTHFSIGRTNFKLTCTFNVQDSKIACMLEMVGNDCNAHFNLLQQEKEIIEQELGITPDWRELPDKGTSYITIENDIDSPSDASKWIDYHSWIKVKLEKFHQVFSERVKRLNADDWIVKEPLQDNNSVISDDN